jgi:hypothetical protein
LTRDFKSAKMIASFVKRLVPIFGSVDGEGTLQGKKLVGF